MNIKLVLDAIEAETGIKPIPFSSKHANKFPAITYQAYKTSDDGVKEMWRLQLRISDKSYASSLGLEKQLSDLLCTVGDEEKFECLQIALNGGGTLEDDLTGVPQIISYYDILARSL